MKEGTIVKTKTRKGTFLGKIDALGNEAYLGIPYCLPAVGERRWLPAQEEPDQETEREAFAFSPLAPQADAGQYAGMPQDEDCLYLNIWKSNRGSEKKAVLVWNHGGSYIKGGTRNPDFNGAKLVAQYPDLIFVSLNHRLGLLANFNLSSLDRDGKYKCSNNLAQLDLRAALKWVHDNIEAFGGDPERVTVYGHSSGSSNISAQFLMADPAKYFKRAIMHSSFALDVGMTSLEQSRRVSDIVLEILGNPTLKELLAMSPQRLLKAQKELLGAKLPPDIKPFSVVEDGYVIPFQSYKRLEQGNCKGYECIIGSACGEYDQQFRSRKDDVEKYEFLKSQVGNRADVQWLLDSYLKNDPLRPPATAIMDIKNDLWIRVPGNLMAKALSGHNRVFLFYTAAEDQKNRVRAPHGNEYRAEFAKADPGLYSEETVQSMRNMLANFVLAGCPCCDNDSFMTQMPAWPLFDWKDQQTLMLCDEPYIEYGVRRKDVETLLSLYAEFKDGSRKA